MFVRRLLRLFLLVVAVGLTAPEAHADTQAWSALFLNVAPTPGPTGPRLWLDLHARRRSDGILGIIRPGFGWQVTPWFSAWAGYDYVPNAIDEGATIETHETWEQVIFSHRVPDLVGLTLRLREEQRFRVAAPDVGHRVRILARSAFDVLGGFGWSLWDEAFVGFNGTEWGNVLGFDQNFAFTGPAWDSHKGFRVEAGYLNLLVHRTPTEDDPSAVSVNHVVAVNVLLTLGVKDKKGV